MLPFRKYTFKYLGVKGHDEYNLASSGSKEVCMGVCMQNDKRKEREGTNTNT